MLSNLGTAMQIGFERNGNPADLNAAIGLLRQAEAATPDGHPDRAMYLSNLSTAFRYRFERNGNPADLDAAIAVGRQAVTASPEGHRDRAMSQSSLSSALQIQFGRTGDLSSLDAAIGLLRQAVTATTEGHPDGATYLSNLGSALLSRFERTGNLASLDAAITAGHQAVTASPDGHPDRAGMLSNLGLALLRRFERTGNLASLDAAITAGRQAVTACPDGHPSRVVMLANLGLAFLRRFERTGNLASLDAAITAGHQAVTACPDDHPDRAMWVSNLGSAVLRKFERTRNPASLDAAISLLGQAAEAAPNHPRRAGMLCNLGIAVLRRFERSGDPADLDAAIRLLRQAAEATPDDHPDQARWLSNLGIALQKRFERSGDPADLDAAIRLLGQAADATPDDHPDQAGWLSNLGIALLRRFERAGNAADLDAATAVSRQALAVALDDHPDRAMYLSNLGATLLRQFERAGNQADLDAAISLLQHAAAATPDDHPDQAMYLSNLGGALQRQFEQTSDPADLDTAISLLRQAAATIPDDHPDQAAYLSNLGDALARRAEQTSNPADLDTAIGLLRQAVAASPDNHPDRAVMLTNLGGALAERAERAGNPADLDAAITAYQLAATAGAAAPGIRVQAALGWGRTAAGGRRWQQAAAGFSAAVELVGLVAPRSLSRSDQEHLLDDLVGLGADAAACCVRAGLTGQAVELFEHGRGVMLGQALDARTDLTGLTERHPGLAARFTILRDDLGRPGRIAGPATAMPASTDGTITGARAEAARRDSEQRRAAAAAFGQVIGQIRRLPGFSGFLRPPPLTELLASIAEGPVVIVTVSRFGSYALIVTAGGVLDPVPLTGLTPQTAYDHVTGFLDALDDAWSPAVGPAERAAARQRLGDTLGWLWEELASPVLARLGITSPPPDGQPWPRLWWCLSGLLSFLPVHAAGQHRTRAGATPATVIDRVISSYTPTLRALAHSRRPRPAGSESHDHPGSQIVAVAMPRTPGAPDLPGAQAEIAMLMRRFPGQVSVLTGAQATPDAVLAALPARWRAHFACHGTSDLDNPSASCLLLTDHQHRQQPLTVVDVARLQLDDARLAFLSACSTARPGARLTDEAIHLASAFQLAGYRHVIATMWPVSDRHAVTIADHIYATLTTTASDVAGAVHAATRQMHQQWNPDTPPAWASHIHVGA